MATPTDDQVVKLLPALEEAARADPDRAPARFVPPRVGILETVAAKRHQFIFGRRGAGKSTLLRKLERDSDQMGANVLFVDIETLRQRPYPDVLIELLIEVLDALRDRLPLRPGTVAIHWQMRRLRKDLRALLAEPQEAVHSLRRLRKRGRGAHAGFDLRRKGLRLGGGASRASEDEEAKEAEFLRTKMEGLLAAAVEIRTVLRSASERIESPILLVLDDFYHVGLDDQPDVLAYLHQVVKNLTIYLKICGVQHRIKPFVEGNPPTGLQLGQDAGDVSLDITLEQFQAGQQFLELVLDGVCEPAGVTTVDLATPTARERLVLGSGGVARDYLELVSKSLRRANERVARPERPHNRITAEDVNESAAELQGRKQNDLALDAGPQAPELRARLTEIVQFCLDRNRTNVFLVEGTDLQEEEWGRQIAALTDLRLMHRLGGLSVPWGPYRGRRFEGFTLDLSHWVGVRSEGIRQIEFWKPGGRTNLRRAGLIYTPTRAATAITQPREEDGESGATEADPGPVDWEQSPLPFEEGEDEGPAPEPSSARPA